MNKKRPIRSLLRPVFPSIAVFVKTLGLVYSRRSMLRQRGYVESSKYKRPCRRDGSPLPWMNYHVIQFLEERLTKDLSLFEYGSGTSTGFYAALVKDVVSIETDPAWYEEVKASAPDNVELIFFDTGAGERYANLAAMQGRRFDVIVVDMLDRTACLLEAPKALTERGVIVLDDSNPVEHRQGIEFLKGQGFRELLFEGLKPGSISAYRTSVFYRDRNCLGI